MNFLMRRWLLVLLAGWLVTPLTGPAGPLAISGIYPSLATFNDEGECGTGAVVPWAGRLWVVSYGPHLPFGSSDKLYEITPDLQSIVRPESVGGTPGNRLIHRESAQLIIGPYFINAQGGVRVIPPGAMPGRLTATARHLTDPANKVYFATMEEGLYEVNVHSLVVTGLIQDNNVPKPGQTAVERTAKVVSQLPGYHGKGLYSSQGRLVYAQNGQRGHAAETDPATPSGALAQWITPGTDWQLVRRNQFTEVTGPGGITGNEYPATDPLWSLGWDARSLILMCLNQGAWHAYRLPKPDHTYDGAHGWYTEWPRIREIGEEDLLMTMHGAFWHFPRNFDPAHSAGIAPRSAYLKIIGDFCRWQDHVVIGCDDAAKIEVPRAMKGKLAPTGQSQSNLQFLEPAQLDQLGPVLGHGAVWLDDAVKAGAPSDPFLFAGYTCRTLFLTQEDPAITTPATFTLEVDRRGDGHWQTWRELTVPAQGCVWTEFAPTDAGVWVRLKARQDCARVSAVFEYHNPDRRATNASPIFAGLPRPGEALLSGGRLHQRGGNIRTLQCIASDGQNACYELDGDLHLHPTNAPALVAWAKANLAIPRDFLTVDDASVVCVENHRRWRLPKGDPSFEVPGAGASERVCREVVTERDLFNAYGTFYELPAESAGGFGKIRPIATHNRPIQDYASYRGLLVLSGVAAGAPGGHIIQSTDGHCALWVGALDDLWQLGKPRGQGGPWQDSPVSANAWSDPYLMTGYDHKTLTLRHDQPVPVTFTLQVDITGNGHWVNYQTCEVKAGQVWTYHFPDSFSAYWARLAPGADCRATARFIYE